MRSRDDKGSAGHGSRVEVCMGMGKTGIPWVPWDSHGNGNKISHGMGMGWECSRTPLVTGQVSQQI